MKSKEERYAYNAVWRKKARAERIAKGLCFQCGKRKLAKHSKSSCLTCLKKIRAYNKSLKGKYNATRAAYGEAWRDKQRIDAFNAYGGPECVCCGENTIEFLELDHINNDGAEHRRELKKSGKWNWIYRWVKRNNYPVGFQVLCCNCNRAKWLYGQCPHEVDDYA